MLVAPRRFQLVEVPTPSAHNVQTGDVLLRVLAGGICGSDLPRYKGMRSLDPRDHGAHAASIPGFSMHEVAGEVVHSEHSRLSPGDRVVGWAMGSDGLAEYVITSGDAVGIFDAGLPPETAVMLQPLACVLHAVERLPLIEGVRVAVMGLGPIGLLFGHVLASRTSARVVGVDRVDRSDMAAAYGFDEVVVASVDRWAVSLSGDARPDVVIEAIGHQAGTLSDAVIAAAPRGAVFHFGVPDDPVYPLPMVPFFQKGLTLMAGVTGEYARGIAEAQDYIRRFPGLPDQYVTHVLPLNRAQEAFDLAERPAVGQCKIVIRVTG